MCSICKQLALASLHLTTLVLLTSDARAQTDGNAFATVASALASPAYLDIEQARNAYSDAMVMFRVEMARQQLMSLTSLPSDLAAVRNGLLGELDACHHSMENLRRLENHLPDFAGLVGETIDAAPGLYRSANKQTLTEVDKSAIGDLIQKAGEELVDSAINAYKSSNERTNYRQHYRSLRNQSRDGIADLCGITRYKEVAWFSGKSISIDVDGSWNNTFTRDWLYVRNDTGRAMTNCTLFVTLEGINADTGAVERDRHFHFMTDWPAGSWIYAPYSSRSASGIASNESVDVIKSVHVDVFSDQVRDSVKYAYSGPDFDKDVERYANDFLVSRIVGSWHNYDPNHTFFNNGFELRYDGTLSRFPASHVTVAVFEGTEQKALRWNVSGSRIKAGAFGKLWLSDQKFNGWEPSTVEVTIEFPNSDYKHVLVWDRK